MQKKTTNQSKEVLMPDDVKDGFFYLSLFEDQNADEMLLGPMPKRESVNKCKAPKGLPSYLAMLWERPLLTAEQEQYGFRKLNYLKYRISVLQKSVHSCRGCVTMLNDLRSLTRQSEEMRNTLVEFNLRLVVSFARRYAKSNSNEFEELVSIGNLALIRAVDLFDFRRGVRFSTYAYQAIQSSIFSRFRKEGRVRSKFVASGTRAVESSIGDASAADILEIESVELREQLMLSFKRLGERDRQILSARFGINQDHRGKSFQAIGKKLGLSTTRTVQLYRRSIAVLQSLLAKSNSFQI